MNKKKSHRVIVMVSIVLFSFIFFNDASAGLYEDIQVRRENEDKMLNKISCEEYEKLGNLSFEEWQQLKDSGIDTSRLLSKCKQEKQNVKAQKLNENAYIDEECGFMIKFPEGWILGQKISKCDELDRVLIMRNPDNVFIREEYIEKYITQDVVKDNDSIRILVLDNPMANILSQEEMSDMSSEEELEHLRNFNLDSISEEKLQKLLQTATWELENSFPDSYLVEKSIKFINNHKVLYQEFTVPKKLTSSGVDMTMDIYQLFYGGRIYQVIGYYEASSEDKNTIINQSIESFVIEDWDVNTSKNMVQDMDYEALKQQALDEAVDQIMIFFITGIFLILLGISVGLLGWMYEKITKKQIEKEKTKEGTIVSSRIRRFINLCIDLILILFAIDNILIYFAIVNDWLFIINNHFIVWLMLSSFYYIFFESVFGRTIGKFFTRTRVISENGERAKFIQIVGRTLARFVPFETFSFLGKWPNGWHDKWSSTLVVNSSYKVNSKINLGIVKFCRHCGRKAGSVEINCDECDTEFRDKNVHNIHSMTSNNVNNSSKKVLVFVITLLLLVFFALVSYIILGNDSPNESSNDIINDVIEQDDDTYYKEEQKKKFKIGEVFYLKSGRKIYVKEVEVGNYYKDGLLRDTGLMKSQVSVRIHSDGGPLDESDYNKMYILKNNQIIKLSNNAANWGKYSFEAPKTSDFDNMELHFDEDIVVPLTPYIKANNF